MNAERAKPRPSPDPPCWAIARDVARAERLAELVAEEGCAVAVGADLGRVLERAPTVLVLDPSGWEESCRHALEDFDHRPAPPPGVLFAAPDPLVLHTAGPALAHLADPVDRDRLTTAVANARAAQARFAAGWPARLEVFPEGEVRRVKAALRSSTGLTIGPDREAALRRALRLRMVARLAPGLRDYADLLTRGGGAPGEAELLAGHLTVHETYFWRYVGQFRSLQETLIPALTRDPADRPRRLRFWSAGCATGEEAYSLAIAGLAALPPGWSVSVIGTDLHRPSLARAAEGVYEARSLRKLPAPLRRRYLVTDGGSERVGEAVRRCVRFEAQNLAAADLASWVAGEGPFDAIFCRNTLIYFDREGRERVLDRFEEALVAGGGLFLGPSESLRPRRPGWEPVRSMGSFHYRKGDRPTPAPVPTPLRREALEPERLERLYRRGLECLDAEEFGAARARFAEILSLCPDDARGHTGMALLLANDGREADAEAHLDRALAAEPRLAETAYLSGLLAERRGEDATALRHYGQALERAPGFFMAHLNRAWILRRMGRAAACRGALRHALQILQGRPRVAPWLTGGMSGDALIDLIADALAGDGDPA